MVPSWIFHRKEWLSKTGSPKSKIERHEFKNETDLTSLKYATFDIIRPKRKKKTR